MIYRPCRNYARCRDCCGRGPPAADPDRTGGHRRHRIWAARPAGCACRGDCCGPFDPGQASARRAGRCRPRRETGASPAGGPECQDCCGCRDGPPIGRFECQDCRPPAVTLGFPGVGASRVGRVCLQARFRRTAAPCAPGHQASLAPRTGRCRACRFALTDHSASSPLGCRACRLVRGATGWPAARRRPCRRVSS